MSQRHHVADVVNFDATQVLGAEHIHEDFDAALFDNFIGLGRSFFDVHGVLKTGATARHDAHAQAALIAGIFGFHKFSHF